LLLPDEHEGHHQQQAVAGTDQLRPRILAGSANPRGVLTASAAAAPSKIGNDKLAGIRAGSTDVSATKRAPCEMVTSTITTASGTQTLRCPIASAATSSGGHNK
jgi:hypothetical protein